MRSIEVDFKEQKRIHKEAAKPLLRLARLEIDNSPRGRMAKSGRVGATKKGGNVKFGNARVPYVRAYIFGHFDRPQGGFMPGDDFLHDAIPLAEGEIVGEYVDHLDDLIRKL